MPDAFQRIVQPRFDARKNNVCHLTGFIDEYNCGLTVSAHIYDKALLPAGDHALYDPHNTLRLTPSVHHAWDARLITIHADGSVSSILSTKQLSALGIKPNARLHKSLLTETRVKYLKSRINDHRAFHIASQLHAYRKRQRLDEPPVDEPIIPKE